MQRVTIVRYSTKPDQADANESLSRAVFAELRATAPSDVAYSVFRDGADFVHVFINRRNADSAILTETPSFKAFMKNASERFAAPPETSRYDMPLIESYGFAFEMAPA